MKKLSICLAFVLMSAGVNAQIKLLETVTAKKGEVTIPYTKYQLSNGLTVILHEDNSDPLVHVDVTYHVGSAREEISKSGFAHFFEHMMFQGSDNVADEQHFKIITESGGTLNGTTNKDRTNYFETVPANQLEKMLWLEADRMGFLLNAVTQKKFEIQRATVKNERGQNYDNRPYGLMGEVSSKHLYPYGHPYSWLTIGYIEDLDRVDVNDLKNFFMRWYGPNNAVLTIGGDIDKAQTLKWVEKYYGSIPRGPEVTPVQIAAPVLDNDRYATLVDNYAKIPMLSMKMPSVPRYHKDEAPLDCLADIIGGGKSSILYQKLVKTQKALRAYAYNPTFELAGEFTFQVMPKPGAPLEDLENEVRMIIASIGTNGIKQSAVDKFNRSTEADMIYGLESVKGKVSQLASYFTFTGNPNYMQDDLKRYTTITKADVMRVYNKYVKGKPMVILSVVPKGKENLQAAAPNHKIDKAGYKNPDYGYDKLTYNKAKDKFDRSKQPKAGAAVSVKVPEVKKITQNINGREVKMISSPSQEIPAIVVQVTMKGGRMVEQNNLNKAGLSRIFSSMMNEDTKNFKAEEISDKLEEMGSSVRMSTSFDGITFTIRSLKKNMPATLEIFKERLYNPIFEENTFNRIKNQTIEGIKNSRTRARTVASEATDRIFFGTQSILGYPSSGTLETVKNIELQDVKDYYNNYVSANGLRVVMVGDFEPADEKTVIKTLDKLEVKKMDIKPLPEINSNYSPNTVFVLDIPKAAQTEFRVGYRTDMKYDATGEYYKSNLMNYALGGAFNSRLNLNLREDKGWTYGARSSFRGDDYSGSYVFSSGIKADKTVQALQEVKKEMTNYPKDGIEESELAFLKSAISQSDARKYETMFQKAGFLGNMLKRDLDVTYVDDRNELLDKMKKKDVNALSQKWIDWKKMQIILAGDAATFKDDLIKLGYKVVKIDADGNIAP